MRLRDCQRQQQAGQTPDQLQEKAQGWDVDPYYLAQFRHLDCQCCVSPDDVCHTLPKPMGLCKGTYVKQWYGIQQVSRDVRHTLALYTDSTLEGAAYHDLKDRNPITH